MSLDFRQVLFCPPTYFKVVDVKNPFVERAAPVDTARSHQQWEKVCAAFAAAGLETQAIGAVEGLEDMVFAANQTFVGADSTGNKFVVTSRMRHPSRRREVAHYVQWFRERGFETVELGLGDNDFLEGGGDLLWQSPTLIWAGHGFRSSPAGVRKFAEAMKARGLRTVPLELTDPRFYHLDTCLAPLREDSVLIYPGAFSQSALHSIQLHCARVHTVPEDEALAFTCNGVSAAGKFITGRLTPGLAAALKAEDLEPVLVDTSEFEKSGGSVCCLKMFVPT
jgi:N-dimethylarginine dimethylaminohydrolase